MPEASNGNSSVTIRKAKNGFIVEAYSKKGSKTYVYDSLKEAVDELESIFSVAEEENTEKEED